MNPIYKRLPRNFLNNVGRYVSLFLLMLLTISFMACFFNVSSSVKYTIDSNQETNRVESGHFIAYEEIEDDVVNSIANDEIYVRDNYYVDVSKEDITFRIYSEVVDVNIPSYFEGEQPSELYDLAVEREFANNNDLHVGDEITFTGVTYHITGIISIPSYSSLFENNNDSMMNNITFGVGVTTKDTFATYQETNIVYEYVYYVENYDELTKEAQEEIHDYVKTSLIESEIGYYDFLPIEHNLAISFLEDDMGSDVPTMILVLVIMLLIIAFIYYVNTKHQIKKEKKLIGILFANGYTKKEILRSYLLIPFLSVLFAGVLGNLLGYYVLEHVMFKKLYYTTYSVAPYIRHFNYQAFLLTTVVPIVIVFTIVFITISNSLSKLPSYYFHERTHLRRIIARIHFNKLSFMKRYRLVVILRNGANYIILFFGVLLATVLLLYGLSTKDSFDHYSEQMYQEGKFTYQYILEGPIDTNEEVDRGIVILCTVDNPLSDNELEVLIYGLEEETFDEELVVKDNEFIVSTSLINKLRLEQNDTILLKNQITNDQYEVVVDERYDYLTGFAIFTSVDTVRELLEIENDEFYNTYFSDNELTIDEGYIISEFYIEDAYNLSEQLTDIFNSISPMIITVSIIVYIIVIFSLSTIIIEHNARSISLLKVLGYDDNEIRKIFLISNFVVVLCSIVVSIPLSSLIMDELFYISLIDLNADIRFYNPMINNVYIIFIGLASYLIVLTALIKKINRVNMVEILKINE